MTAQLDMFAAPTVEELPPPIASTVVRFARGTVQGPIRPDRFDPERRMWVAACPDCLMEVQLAFERGVRFLIEPDNDRAVFALEMPASSASPARICQADKMRTHSSHFAFCGQTRHRRPRAGEAPFRKSFNVAMRIVNP